MLRRPVWAFAALGLLIILIVGYALTVFVASGIGYDAGVARALAWPAALGAGLASGSLWIRIKGCRIRRHRDAALRSAIAWGATGFAWPLSFGVSTLLQGDAAGLQHSLLPAIVGGLLGAAAGGVAGYVASLAVLTRR